MNRSATPNETVTKREIAAYTLLFVCFMGGAIFALFPTRGLQFIRELSQKYHFPQFLKCAFTDSRQCDHRTFWVATHFVLYFILGLLIPHRGLLVGTSILFWELFERGAGIYSDWFNEGNFFHKSLYDILADVVGYLFGALLAQYLFSSY